jgi:hypothetical protein
MKKAFLAALFVSIALLCSCVGKFDYNNPYDVNGAGEDTVVTPEPDTTTPITLVVPESLGYKGKYNNQEWHYVYHELAAQDSIAIVAAGEADFGGIDILDLSSPWHPDSIKRIQAPWAQAVVIRGKYAYVAAEIGILVLDIDTPRTVASLRVVDTIPFPAPPREEGIDLAVRGGFLYAVRYDGLMAVCALGDSTGNSVRAQFSIQTDGPIAIGGSALYTIDDKNLRIYGIEHDTVLTLIKTLQNDSGVTLLDLAVARDGRKVYLCGQFGYVAVVDVSNPASAFIVKSLDVRARPLDAMDYHHISSIVLNGPYAYVCAREIGPQSSDGVMHALSITAADTLKVLRLPNGNDYFSLPASKPGCVALYGTTVYLCDELDAGTADMYIFGY